MSATRQEIRDQITFVYFNDAKVADGTRIELIGNELLEILTRSQPGRLVLNFREVQFMSSAMISKLVAFERACRKHNASLRLCEIGQSVREVFKLTNLDRLFEICDSEEQAIVSFDLKA